MKQPPKLILNRYLSNSLVTLGYLRFDNEYFHTLELPWKENAPRQSCIPYGSYSCAKKLSPKFGETYIVKSVPGRSDILFHVGNTVLDTEGCILLGDTSYLAERRLSQSRKAMNRFMSLLAFTERFDLLIVDSWRYTPAKNGENLKVQP